MPTSAWYHALVETLLTGESSPQAIRKANRFVEDPRSFARTTLSNKDGGILPLSIAIEGGGRQLRNFNRIEHAALSEHGHWRKNHFKGIETIYGRSPFFPYLGEKLLVVYENYNIRTLEEFNFKIHEALLDFLLGQIPYRALNLLKDKRVIQERGREIAMEIEANANILFPLMQFGPETLPGILMLNK